MQTETRVVLSTPIEYAGKDGNIHRGTFIVLRAPTSAAFRVALKLKQEMVRAIMAEARRAVLAPEAPKSPEPEPAAEGAEPKPAEKPTGEDVFRMLAQSSADLVALGEGVRELLSMHGVGLLDGEVRMTDVLIDRLSLSDFESVVGEYLGTFLLA